ncbi:hypothetical protein [Geodermatophilus marinus]|uniref:hypothetical protein n=1 Tax=Geodermatophilus sp. LHW52908 TaxID=2303986 RepID=UPI000E3E988E|nr:hypothetical protein [Geodermatophilus sp. LHW52908]RFU20110.1 hypothetical protein D0Z06_17620 [Geodermatophilus sp. LHW52908]
MGEQLPGGTAPGTARGEREVSPMLSAILDPALPGAHPAPGAGPVAARPVTLDFADPRLLARARDALAGDRPVVVRLTGAAAQRAATVFLGSDYRLYDRARTVLNPAPLPFLLGCCGLADLARVVAMSRLHGHRVDVQYLDAEREFRLTSTPPRSG